MLLPSIWWPRAWHSAELEPARIIAMVYWIDPET